MVGAACSQHGASDAPLSSDGVAMLKFLAGVTPENPSKDVDAALARGDRRLLGLNGFTCAVPGVSEAANFEENGSTGINCIVGTSDIIIVGEEAIRARVSSYAAAYNVELLKRLKPASPNMRLERPRTMNKVPEQYPLRRGAQAER